MTRIVTIEKTGSPEVLKIKNIKLDKPGPEEVTIEHKAIGLNYIDTYHRSGLYPLKLPSGIGAEASGIIKEIGSQVKDFNFEIPFTHNSFVYLIEGEIKIGDKKHKKVKNSTLILVTKGNKLKVKGIIKSKFLLISGKPIGESIARGGPFVMNTKEEILKAVEDYHSGNFVQK